MHTFTGQTIRGYDIQQQIGTGAAGTVYKAYQPAVARYVAIKVIRTDTSGLFEQQFNEEARLIARLEHLNIVPLYDFWSDDQAAYLVMRLFNAGTLRDLIDQQGALSLAQTIRIVDQVADALMVAHEAGIIHRDIKPENILLDDRGNAYLTDFGIAKQLDRAANTASERMLIGTISYASPEQIGQGVLSEQSDLYSFGLVVFEMLSGHYAYTQVEGSDVMSLLTAHIEIPLPSVFALRPDLPSDIDLVLRQATAKDSAARFSSALEFSAKLRALNEPNASAPPTVRPGSPLPRALFRPRRRNRDFMLTNVRKFWIEGVLNHSLYSSVLIALNLVAAPDQTAETASHPWDMIVRSETALPDGLTILDCFDQLNGKLLILGQPGSGKTTTLLELARDLLTRAEGDDQHPIPVIVNLSSWSASQQPIEDWLVSELNSQYQTPRSVARTWVSEDQLLPLFDGLDEVAHDRREACVTALNAYRQQHSFVDMVICSRIADYNALAVKLKLNGAIVVKPLSDAQIDHYMAVLGLGSAELHRLLSADATLRELTRTPFMLSVLALTYGNRTTQSYAALRRTERQSVETLRQAIFGTYVERVFERRLADSKAAPDSGYSEAQTVDYLTWLAAHMQSHAQSVFQIEGLQSSWLTDIQRQHYYRAVRLTFLISMTLLLGGWRVIDGVYQNVPLWWYGGLALVGGAVWGGLLGSSGFKRLPFAIVPGLLLGVAWGGGVAGRDGLSAGVSAGVLSVLINMGIFIVGAILLRRTGNDRDHIVPTQKLQFSWQRVNRYVVLGVLSLAVLYFFPKHLTPVNILATTVSSLLLMAVALLSSGIGSDKIEMNAMPNEGIIRSFRFGILLGGLVVFTLFIAVTAQAIGDWSQLGSKIIDSITSGITIGHTAVLVFGLFPLIHHLCLRRVLHRAQAIPRDYAAFLDYAAQLTLLRKVGNGYIFVHRYLLEYFADLRPVQVPAAGISSPIRAPAAPFSDETKNFALEAYSE